MEVYALFLVSFLIVCTFRGYTNTSAAYSKKDAAYLKDGD